MTTDQPEPPVSDLPTAETPDGGPHDYADELMALIRKETGQSEKVDVREVLEQVATALYEAGGAIDKVHATMLDGDLSRVVLTDRLSVVEIVMRELLRLNAQLGPVRTTFAATLDPDPTDPPADED